MIKQSYSSTKGLIRLPQVTSASVDVELQSTDSWNIQKSNCNNFKVGTKPIHNMSTKFNLLILKLWVIRFVIIDSNYIYIQVRIYQKYHQRRLTLATVQNFLVYYLIEESKAGVA